MKIPLIALGSVAETAPGIGDNNNQETITNIACHFFLRINANKPTILSNKSIL